MRSYIFFIPLRLIVVAVYDYLLFVLSHQKHFKILYKMKNFKRFLGAWYIGHLVAEKHQLQSKAIRYFSDTYAYWILAVISLDSFIDNPRNNSKASKQLIDEIKLILYSEPNSFYGSTDNDIGISCPESFTKTLFSSFMYRIHFLMKIINQTYFDHFLIYALRLIDGEEQSILQRQHSVNINLGWYIKTLMPRKTYPFILAPIALLSDGEKGSIFAEYKNDLKKIDEACNYWQVQDDIADLEEDLNNGILSAPSLFLIEQCRIAKNIRQGSIANTEQLLDELKNGEMLTLHPLGCKYSNDFYEISKFVFSNTALDASMSYEEVITKYSSMSFTINEQLSSKNYKAFFLLVIRNGVSDRLIANIESFDLASSKITDKRKNVISFVGIIMRKAILRANIKCHENKYLIS